MSERLREMIRKELFRLGDSAEYKLALKAGVSPSLINNVKNGRIPLAKNIRKIALACGLGEEEALKLAEERSSELARETA